MNQSCKLQHLEKIKRLIVRYLQAFINTRGRSAYDLRQLQVYFTKELALLSDIEWQ